MRTTPSTPLTITPLTLQQVFDLGVNGIRAQGYKRSVSAVHGSACLYRGAEDCKCIVGHAIPDGVYDPGMDNHHGGNGVDVLLTDDDFPNLSALFFGLRLRTLRELQLLHDMDLVHGPGMFESAARGFAERHSLIYTPPAAG